MEIGHWSRDSIIIRSAKSLDPDEEIERKISDRERVAQLNRGGAGKDKRREKGKGKRKEKEKETEVSSRGAEAVLQDDVSLGEEAALSTYNDIPGRNGEQARLKEEDHYGFLYSISEADRH